MTSYITGLVNALREELQQYGEMLACLDEQQDFISRRAAEALVASTDQVEQQMLVVQKARSNRMAFLHQLLAYMELPKDTIFVDLLPRLPADYRPLVKALVEENNSLLHKIQSRTRQNHLLLTHSLNSMRSLMRSLFPSRTPTLYNETGLLPRGQGTTALYEAIG